MIFTRLLYIKDEVKYSLLVALLRKTDEDEILFWTYELYYSGFQEETMEYILKIYADFFEILNPNMKKFIQKKNEEWKRTQDPTIPGTIVRNMVGRPCSTAAFITKYMLTESPVVFNMVERNYDAKFFITFDRVAKYTSFNCSVYRMLHECRFATCRPNSVFATSRLKNALQQYRENWMYYALFSPVWCARIQEYGGRIVEKHIGFADEDTEEEFGEKYNCEPDEQSSEIQQRCVGDNIFNIFTVDVSRHISYL